MPFNPSFILFSSSLILGTLITITSNSWFAAWIGLEINLLSFIPLLISGSPLSSESALKYFLTQALASSSLLLTIMILYFLLSFNLMNYFSSPDFFMLLSLPLFLKAGVAPFHFWFPMIIEGMKWNNSFILLTWQKIAPFILLTYFINSSLFFITPILFSAYIGAIGGFNQTSLRKIMAFSSINHMSLNIIRYINKPISIYNLSPYLHPSHLLVILIFKNFNMNFISQTYSFPNMSFNLKLMIFLNFLSLGGLPPFLGFFPKWMIILSMIYFNMITLIFWMLMMSLLTLYFYSRISYSTFMFNFSEMKFYLFPNYHSSNLIIFMTSLSTLGLPLIMLINFFI
uniref:NADH-ubiquinone oxidoreductase chain 2 n=1 Tax=Habrophlebiodes zijinensis TaxID=289472 RepID=A0A0B4IKE2_9INSE|nr:NADH dehydrogenase subunit 2 [Habrophlebiodes zijinensis]